MSFKLRLWLGFLFLGLSISVLSFGMGYLQFRHALNSDLQEDVQKFSSAIQDALYFEGHWQISPSVLMLETAWQNGRFRLLDGSKVLLEAGGAFPQQDNAWMVYQKTLPTGGLLQVALNLEEHHKALDGYWKSGIVTVVISGGVAMLLAVLLHRLLLQPLQQLSAAATALSQGRFTSVAIPKGHDELSQLAEQFNTMTHEIQGLLSRERSFTRYASHELRTPLASIGLQLDAVKENLLPLEQALPVVDKHIERMQHILDALLILARHPQVSLQEIHTRECLAHHLQPRVEVSGESSTVMAHPQLLSRVLDNVIGNALKYSSETVHLRLTPQHIHVSNPYSVIPTETLQRLGEPFFRVNHTNTEGLGLGLALSRHAMRAMGGELHLEHTGTHFVVSLRFKQGTSNA